LKKQKSKQATYTKKVEEDENEEELDSSDSSFVHRKYSKAPPAELKKQFPTFTSSFISNINS
jgi:hypothetical protein